MPEYATDVRTVQQPPNQGTTFAVALMLVLLLLLASSCGTIDSQVEFWSPEDPEAATEPSLLIYGGFARDLEWASLMFGEDRWSNPEILVLLPAWILDVPLSLVGDTLALPMTLTQQLWVWLD